MRQERERFNILRVMTKSNLKRDHKKECTVT